MIAPYWSDIDTRCGGCHRDPASVYYRQLRLIPGSDLYKKIQNEVALSSETDNSAFKPTSVVIVTWEAVRPSGCYDEVCSGLIIVMKKLPIIL